MSAIFPQTQNTSPDTETEERVEVNLDEEVEVANPEGDFNERTAPPPASGSKSAQAFRWSLGEKGVVPGVDKNKKSFLNVYLVGELLGVDGYEGFTTNYYMNSIIFKGKTTSEVHHFLNAVGEPAGRMSLGQLKEKIEEVCANHPTSYAETEWKTGYQGTEVDPKTNKPKWVDQYLRMDQFPLVDEIDEAGNKTGRKIRSFIAKSAKDGEPIYAQFYIKRLLSTAEAQKRLGKTTT